MNTRDRHMDLLDSFYSQTPPSWFTENDDLDRWKIERDRRTLDISRLCWRFWPLSCGLATAFRGNDFMLEVVAMLPAFLSEATDIDNTARLALQACCSQNPPDYLCEVHAYESASRNVTDQLRPGTVDERSRIPGSYEGEVWCLDTTVDLARYIKTLSYYTALHAPGTLVRELAPTSRPGCLAFYRRAGTMRMLDITNPADVVGTSGAQRHVVPSTE